MSGFISGYVRPPRLCPPALPRTPCQDTSCALNHKLVPAAAPAVCPACCECRPHLAPLGPHPPCCRRSWPSTTTQTLGACSPATLPLASRACPCRGWGSREGCAALAARLTPWPAQQSRGSTGLPGTPVHASLPGLACWAAGASVTCLRCVVAWLAGAWSVWLAQPDQPGACRGSFAPSFYGPQLAKFDTRNSTLRQQTPNSRGEFLPEWCAQQACLHSHPSTGLAAAAWLHTSCTAALSSQTPCSPAPADGSPLQA